MSTPFTQHGALRTVRCGVRGAASGTLAIAAHALAGGGVPDTALAVLLVAVVGWAASASADRTRGLLGVIAVLGTGQLLMHVVLSVLTTHHHGGQAAPHTVGMAFTHAVATTVTAVLVVRAEDALRTIVASLRTLLPVVWLPPPLTSSGTRRLAAVPSGTAKLIAVMLRRGCRPRGPPRDS